jgi:D-glycero-D-manno-heptose 1,7-bisphosphate phosphatase
MNKAIFIDKDGTLIDDIPYNVNPSRIKFTEGAPEGLKKLSLEGYLLIIVSNQSGIARGYFTEAEIEVVEKKIKQMMASSSIQLDGFYYCPHHPDGTVEAYAYLCNCRKPKPGLILQASKDFNIDLSRSWMIGDILHDIEAGNRAGCKTVLLDNGNETEWCFDNIYRQPTAFALNILDAASIILETEKV